MTEPSGMHESMAEGAAGLAGVGSLLDQARYAADQFRLARAISDLLDLVREWSCLREPFFRLLIERKLGCDAELAFRCAEDGRMDLLLGAATVAPDLIDAACNAVLVLSAYGEDWFGEPKMEPLISPEYCLDRLECGAAALPALVGHLARCGSTLEHALTLACLFGWSDFCLSMASDPLSGEEWDALRGRGWTRERIARLGRSARAALRQQRFDACLDSPAPDDVELARQIWALRGGDG